MIMGIKPSKDLLTFVSHYDLIEIPTLDAEPTTMLTTHQLNINYGQPSQIIRPEYSFDVPAMCFSSMVYKAAEMTTSGELKFIAVHLKPHILHHVLKGGLEQINNRCLDVEDLSLPIKSDWLPHAIRSARNNVALKINMVERYLRQLFRCISPQRSPIVDYQLQRVNISEPFNYETDMGYSERHMRREFTKYIGVAPKQYTDIQRILYASQSLTAKPALNLNWLSQQLGFYDYPHFFKIFKKYMGVSPSNYVKTIASSNLNDYFIPKELSNY